MSILMGLLLPRTPLTVPGWAYLLLPVIMPLHGVLSDRKRQKLLESDE